MSASTTSAIGLPATAIPAATTAAASSEAIITRRRSKRSPSVPRSDVAAPSAPIAANRAADIHAVECVEA